MGHAVTIGSSDAAAIMGVSPHETPWRCWARMVGLLPPREATEAMESGLFMQPFIVKAAVARLGGFGFETGPTRYAGARPWQRATPDAIYWAPETPGILIEAKASRWAPPDEPELHWVIQSQHQLAVFDDAPHAVIAAFGALALRLYVVERHPAFIDTLVRREEAFLELIEKQTPPPTSAADDSWIAKAYPVSESRTVALGPEMMRWDQQRQEAAAAMAPLAKQKKEAEAAIRQAMGSAEKATLPDGTAYTWKTYTYEQRVTPARTTRTLRRSGDKNGSSDD
jgi:predicted phage-related endonuclease